MAIREHTRKSTAHSPLGVDHGSNLSSSRLQPALRLHLGDRLRKTTHHEYAMHVCHNSNFVELCIRSVQYDHGTLRTGLQDIRMCIPAQTICTTLVHERCTIRSYVLVAMEVVCRA